MQKGCENMNRIFKVIWSKTKNCYVVASELAKGTSKSTSTGRMAKRAVLAAVAALLISPLGAGYVSAADDYVTVKDVPGTGQTVYTKDGVDNQLKDLAKQTDVTTNQNNIATLDTQVKANADAVATKANAADVYTKTETDSKVDAVKKEATTYTYRKVAAEEAARKAADNELNERITNEANAIHNEIKSGDTALDNRITAVKESLQQEAADTYVSKDDASVQDGAVVKANNKVGQNVQALDTALAKETAARIGADKAQDAVIQQVNQNAANGIATLATAYNNEVASREAADNELNERITNEANEIHKTTNQLQSDLATETADRKTADNELNERITNEANAIHETTNQLQNDLNTETAAREAGDTALDTRITNVKEYLEKQTSDKYVSKDDAAVQDGAIVKAANTIGDNVTKLDAALASETAARIGADKAQDKVIQQVNQNMVDGFNTINKNMADGFTALNQADANEAAARVAADTKLVEAVNSGLSLSNDNVLQKNTTTIDAQGNVTTSKTDANEMILNKGKDNQITLNEKGIKVGTNSSVMDKDGVYTGGDTFDAAKAAMKSDGQIKGANGKFTVDASGNTSVTSLDAGTGTIQTKGDLYAKDATFSGDITAKDATLSGDFSAKDGTFSGDLSAKDGTFSGDVSAKDVTATGTRKGPKSPTARQP